MTYEERLREYAEQHSDKWRIENGEHCLPWASFREEAEVTIAAVAEGIKFGLKYMGCDDRTIDTVLFEEGYLKEMPEIPHSSLVDENNRRWYNAECQNCKWHGSSKYLGGGGAIADTGDYSDIYCPYCGSSDIDDYIV